MKIGKPANPSNACTSKSSPAGQKLPGELVLDVFGHAGFAPAALVKLNALSSQMRELSQSNVLWGTFLAPPSAAKAPEANFYSHLKQLPAAELQALHALWTLAPTDPNIAARVIPSLYRYPDNWAMALAGLKLYGPALRIVKKEFRDDETLVMAAVKQNGSSLAHASERLRDNFAVAKAALADSGAMYRYLSDRLKASKELAILAVSSASALYHPVAEIHLQDKDVMYAAIKKSGDSWMKFAQEIREEREAVLLAVKNGMRHYLPLDFNDDEEIVLEQIQRNDYLFSYASSRLRDDEAFVRKALVVGASFEHASERLKSMHDLGYFAAMQNVKNYWVVCDSVKNDRELLLHLMDKSPSVIVSAGASLRGDDTLMMRAIELDSPSLLKYASERIRDNKDVALKAVKSYGGLLEYVSDRLKCDLDVASAAVRRTDSAIRWVSKETPGYKDLLILAIEGKDPYSEIFPFLTRAQEQDPEIVAAGLRSANRTTANHFLQMGNDEVLKTEPFLSLTLAESADSFTQILSEIQDRKILLRFVQMGYFDLNYLPAALKDDKELMMAAVSSGVSLSCASLRLREDPDVRNAAEMRSGYMLNGIGPDFVIDKDLAMRAVRQYPLSYRDLPDTLRRDPDIISVALTGAKSMADKIDPIEA